MTPECLILIARLCLRTETESVTFSGAIVGRGAVARLPDAELRFDLWSDALGGKPEGKRRFCRDGACIYFEATADSAHHRLSYEFQFDHDQTPRPLSITASSAPALERAKRKVQMLLSVPGERAVFASLADLEH